MKHRTIAASVLTAAASVSAMAAVPDCQAVVEPHILLSGAGTLESIAFDKR